MVDTRADELFRLDPAEFVAARDQLAKDLRSEGDRDGAKVVKALRRPSVAAWALNQVAIDSKEALDDLAELGAALQAAQESGDTGALRDLSRRRREAIGSLGKRVQAVLDARAAGTSAGHRDEALATLEAASVDPEVFATLRAGRLVAAAQPPSGFPGLSLVPAPDDTDPAPAADLAERRYEKQVEAARQTADEADRSEDDAEAADEEVARLEAALADARAAAKAAHRQATDARRQARKAEATRAKAEQSRP